MSGRQLDIGGEHGIQSGTGEEHLCAYLREFGFKWAQAARKNKFAKPTVEEIIGGLKKLVERKVREETE